MAKPLFSLSLDPSLENLRQITGARWRWPLTSTKLFRYGSSSDTCPDSRLRISGTGWSGGVLMLDEWMQQAEHLLLSTGTGRPTTPMRGYPGGTHGCCRLLIARSAAPATHGLARLRAATSKSWGVRLLLSKPT